MNPFTVITFLLIATVTTVSGNNITDILSQFPEYSEYNSYLTQTKLNDEINNQGTVTVLVFNNTVVTKYLANQPLSITKAALSIHVLLDFFDFNKLLTIGGGSATTTTLYQTTGTASNNNGFVNITDLPGKKIGFGSGLGATNLVAFYTKSVQQIPYNISVLEINSLIITPAKLAGTAAAPSPSPSKLSDMNINITNVLENAGCKTFARLISQTGVLTMFENAESKGLTLFAPKDSAFNVTGLPNFNNLTNIEFNSVLKFHAISSYVPKASLINEKNPVNTLASNRVDKFNFTIRVNGDSITIDSGVDVARVESMVFDQVPISIHRIDNVLLPINYFNGTILGSVPVPVPVPVPAPAPLIASTPVASSPKISSPGTMSSPADAGLAPADGPTADLEKSGASNGCGGIKGLMFLLAIVMV